LQNTNATIARSADDVCFGVFKLNTWDCGLDQPILGQAMFKQGAAEACGHDQSDSRGSSSISGGNATAVDKW
jgi:hypothetical protein